MVYFNLTHDINQQVMQIISVLMILSLMLLQPAQAETDCTAVTEIPQAECETLLNLYNSTDGPNWAAGAEQWHVTNTPCSWQGVDCSTEGYVTQLANCKVC